MYGSPGLRANSLQSSSVDVSKSLAQRPKSSTKQRQYSSPTGSKITCSQRPQSFKSKLQQNTTRSHLNSGVRVCAERPRDSGSLRIRCLSAPFTRTVNGTPSQNNKLIVGKDEYGVCRKTLVKQRSVTAPNNTKSARSSVNSSFAAKSSPAERQDPKFAQKFSASWNERKLDDGSLSDVMFFCDDTLQRQSYTFSDDSSVAAYKFTPQSCVSFRRSVYPVKWVVPSSNHHCATYVKNRPHWATPNLVRVNVCLPNGKKL